MMIRHHGATDVVAKDPTWGKNKVRSFFLIALSIKNCHLCHSMERNRIATRIMIIAFLVFLGLCYLIWAPNTMEDFDGYDAEPMSKTEADSFLQSIQTKLSEGW